MFKTALIAVAACSPVAAHALEFPLRANDLGVKERYLTGDHGGGTQDEGKDVVARRLTSGSSWTTLVTDTADQTKNASYLAYGRPVYAMAEGTVIKCWRNAPENAVVGKRHPALEEGKMAGGGNHLWVRHADGSLALYAHMIPGSIATTLCPHNDTLFTKAKGNTEVENGAKVVAGQVLGRIGNSGSSSSPHLHVHMELGGKPMKMPFARGLITSYVGDKADFNGPWKSIDGVLPDAPVLVWAPRKRGSYTWKGTSAEEYQGLFDHMSNSGMMPKWISCTGNGSSYSAEWQSGSGQWRSHHGMNAAAAAEKHALYTGQGFTRTSSYTCGSRTVAVWRK